MDNNQFNQYNGQQPMQQPMQQPVQQPMYNQPAQPVYGQPQKKSNVGLIIGIVVGVLVILFVVIPFVKGFIEGWNSSSNIMDGNWTCTGTNGTLKINADTSNKKVVLQISSLKIDATYERSGSVTPAKKKDGYKYTQYVFTGGSNSAGQTYSKTNKVGFVFGVDPNNKNVAHYVDGVSATSMDFACTRD